jgi:hypothetical protein
MLITVLKSCGLSARLAVDIVPGMRETAKPFLHVTRRHRPRDIASGIMSEIEKGQVMTANRLRDGEVVFLTRSGAWNEKSMRPCWR